MQPNRIFIGTVSIASMLLTSCSSLSSWASENPYGVEEIINPELVDTIDLIKLLDPLNKAWITPTMPAEERLGRALDAFYYKYGTEPNDLKRRRDGLQERILIASSQLASEYEKYLKRYDSAANFSLGTMTTTLAGLGSIFTSLDTVRALAGSAAITSGVRAEWNETMFSKVTIQVLVKGIRTRRTRLYEDIVQRRTGKTVHEYTVEQAIKDAIEYHGAFNLVVGLEESAIALDRKDNPGLEELQKMLGNKVIARGLGLPTTPKASPEVPATVDLLVAAVQPFTTDQADATATQKKAMNALDRLTSLAASPPILTPVPSAIGQAKTDLATAGVAFDAAVTAAQAKVDAEASKNPTVESIKQSIALLAVDLTRLSGDALLQATERMPVELARAAVKSDELRLVAKAEKANLQQAAKDVAAKAGAAADVAATALLGLPASYLTPYYATLDQVTASLKASPADPTVVRAARLALQEGDAVATRIDAAIGDLLDRRPELRGLTQELRDTLAVLRLLLKS